MAIFTDLAKYVKEKKKEKNIKEMRKVIVKIIDQRLEKIMTKNVVTVNEKEPIIRVIVTMMTKNISCVVVVDKDYSPIGLVTERDILMKLPLDQDKVSNMVAGDIMSKGAISATPDSNLFEATDVMIKHHFRKLPIVNNAEQNKLVGIVTQTDLVRAYDIFQTKLQIETIDLLQVRQLMTTKIKAVQRDTGFPEARKIMIDNNISCILIMKGAKVEGIFTEKNFIEQLSLNITRLNQLQIENIMVYPVVTINPDYNIFEANNLMLSKNFRRLPVEVNGNLMGIVTQTDILRGTHDFLNTTIGKIDKGKIKEVDIEIIE